MILQRAAVTFSHTTRQVFIVPPPKKNHNLKTAFCMYSGYLSLNSFLQHCISADICSSSPLRKFREDMSHFSSLLQKKKKKYEREHLFWPPKQPEWKNNSRSDLANATISPRALINQIMPFVKMRVDCNQRCFIFFFQISQCCW